MTTVASEVLAQQRVDERHRGRSGANDEIVSLDVGHRHASVPPSRDNAAAVHGEKPAS